jgi:hypothetical protein
MYFLAVFHCVAEANLSDSSFWVLGFTFIPDLSYSILILCNFLFFSTQRVWNLEIICNPLRRNIINIKRCLQYVLALCKLYVSSFWNLSDFFFKVLIFHYNVLYCFYCLFISIFLLGEHFDLWVPLPFNSNFSSFFLQIFPPVQLVLLFVWVCYYLTMCIYVILLYIVQLLFVISVSIFILPHFSFVFSVAS